ncbi:phosphotransferase [Amycolatopsis taiwanensis]|uniref:HTH gntR-type domain-containing protein n=1 Tax=Amycolatopsis taiwanensis TaxID=342230 RepID=A0A9W6R5B0_9PSEU|nr:phosphotransferase [Amycolatopsis taiwanensis]GLY69709.1 hypothetical protein Atai01_63280 [Amycolatopsis taiwanensis]
MNFNLDDSAPRYIYKAMADHITRRIESGELQPRQPLPAERRLADEYGVSLGTARRATELLRERGLVVTLRSKGTYITDPNEQADQTHIGATTYGITVTQEHRTGPVIPDFALSHGVAVDPTIEKRYTAEEPRAFSPTTTRMVLEEACRKVGLDARGASLMWLGAQALYRLESAPLVVRIARTMDHWARTVKEVNVARWLAELDFPAAELFAVGQQPLSVSGHPVSFWRFIHGSPATPDHAGDFGKSLSRLHHLPAPTDFDLPRLDILGRVETRVERASVPDADKDMLLARCRELRDEIAKLEFPLAATVIHGAAHINVMIDAGRLVLIDFENVAWGQPEWDLAVAATDHLTAGWRATRQYADFTDAYGFDVTSWDGFHTLRAAHEITMTTRIMHKIDHSLDFAQEYQRRIQLIRTGEAGRPRRPC